LYLYNRKNRKWSKPETPIPWLKEILVSHTKLFFDSGRNSKVFDLSQGTWTGLKFPEPKPKRYKLFKIRTQEGAAQILYVPDARAERNEMMWLFDLESMKWSEVDSSGWNQTRNHAYKAWAGRTLVGWGRLEELETAGCEDVLPNLECLPSVAYEVHKEGRVWTVRESP
jgi:hypothetical protein